MQAQLSGTLLLETLDFNMNTYRFMRTNAEGNVYSDTVMLPEDHTFTDDEILAMQDERFQRWLIAIAPPAITEEPVVEELAITEEPVV